MTLVRRTSALPATAKYPEHRPQLRRDFWYSCAYCTITELEASGVGFEIDHYVPVSRAPHLEHTYANLYYSCERCNGQKSDHPSVAAQMAGKAFFRADVDVATDHFELKGERVVGITEDVGKYTELMLRLNSGPLQRLRKLRRELHYTREAMLEGIRGMSGIRIDQIPGPMRERYLTAREQLREMTVGAGEARAELLQSMAKSQLLDADETDSANERRQYLKQMEKAILGPD